MENALNIKSNLIWKSFFLFVPFFQKIYHALTDVFQSTLLVYIMCVTQI